MFDAGMISAVDSPLVTNACTVWLRVKVRTWTYWGSMDSMITRRCVHVCPFEIGNNWWLFKKYSRNVYMIMIQSISVYFVMETDRLSKGKKIGRVLINKGWSFISVITACDLLNSREGKLFCTNLFHKAISPFDFILSFYLLCESVRKHCFCC